MEIKNLSKIDILNILLEAAMNVNGWQDRIDNHCDREGKINFTKYRFNGTINLTIGLEKDASIAR